MRVTIEFATVLPLKRYVWVRWIWYVTVCELPTLVVDPSVPRMEGSLVGRPVPYAEHTGVVWMGEMGGRVR